MDDKSLLRTGGALLALSLIVAVLTQGDAGLAADHRAGYVLAAWIERAAFWLGFLFVAAWLLCRVLEASRRP